MGKKILKEPSKHTLYMREWRAKNPDNLVYMRKKNAEYATDEDFAKAARERAKAWYAANKDRARANVKKYAKSNIEKIQASKKAWVMANMEARREYMRNYVHLRRAKIRGNTIGQIDLDAVLARCNGVCGICGKSIEGKYHFDHIIPIAKGGPHIEENLQMAHPRCNQLKSATIGFSLIETEAA